MTIALPGVIAEYFAADKTRDAEAFAGCFTQDAVVIDERKTYNGRDAIRQWIEKASTQYTYTSEPFAMSEEEGRTIVTSHLSGNFPGSPVDVRYLFELDGSKIARLEIVP